VRESEREKEREREGVREREERVRRGQIQRETEMFVIVGQSD